MSRLGSYVMSNRFTKEEIAAMEDIISSFFEKTAVTLSAPVDIFVVAKNLGFDVRAAALPDRVDGLVMVDEYSKKIGNFNSNKVIAYNIQLGFNDKKFIVAHELAHYISAKHAQTENENRIVFATRDHANGYSENVEEQKMDFIAAAILIPRDDLREHFGDSAGTRDENFYSRIADYYHVDIELAKRRVGEVFGEQQTAI